MKIIIILFSLFFFCNLLAAQTLDLSDKSYRIAFEKLYTQKQLAPYYEDKELFDYLKQIDFEALQKQLNNDPSIQRLRFDRYTDIESYGLWMYLLNKDKNSVFYNKKDSCQKRLKTLVPKLEWEYLSTALVMFDSIESKGDVDALWGALLSTAVTEEQRTRFGQYWQNAARIASPKRNLEDIEAVLTYDLGAFYIQNNEDKKALPYYQKWFELRKEQGGYLAGAYLKMRGLYTNMGKHKEAYELWETYDAVVAESGLKDENGWHAAKFRTALNDLARYKDQDKAIKLFEQDYLAAKKVYVKNGMVWWHEVPYAWAVENSKTPENQIKYLKQWAAAIQKYTDKSPLIQANAAIELLACHTGYNKNNEEVQQVRIQCFEELYLANLVKASPTYKASFIARRALESWALVVPYESMINALIANKKETEVKEWYKKWLEAAIQTKDEEIIRTTCIKVFDRLGKEQKETLAEEFFIEYYCKRLRIEDGKEWEVSQEWPYRWMQEKPAEQAQKWVNLAQKHGAPALLAWVLDYAAAHSSFHAKNPQQNLVYMQQKLALVKKHEQLDFINSTYISLTSVSRELNKYPLALKYSIEDYLFDKKHGFKTKYSRLSLFHAVVSGCLTKSEITAKDKKDMKKQLKKLEKQLKKDATQHTELLNWIEENIAYFDF